MLPSSNLRVQWQAGGDEVRLWGTNGSVVVGGHPGRADPAQAPLPGPHPQAAAAAGEAQLTGPIPRCQL